MFQDKTLVCKDCGNEFVFTEGEQQFYAEKGFENEPQRCKDCRNARKSGRGERPSRELHAAICAECGCETQVPFVPRDERPVYCRDCYSNKQSQ
ncbi:MAG: zinc-ribbon domain containing protein [Carboxydocellales bacterium]|jgi:CxxC-x17-CxxC domain-containing protein